MAFSQHSSAHNHASSSAASYSYSGNVTANTGVNLLLVAVDATTLGSGGSVSITDNSGLGLTWQQALSDGPITSNYTALFWAVTPSLAAAKTITVTVNLANLTSTTWSAADFLVIDGLSSWQVDVSGSLVNTSPGTVQTLTADTTTNDLVVSVAGDGGGSATTYSVSGGPGGWSGVVQDVGGGANCAVSWATGTTLATQSATWSNTAGFQMTMLIATFKTASTTTSKNAPAAIGLQATDKVFGPAAIALQATNTRSAAAALALKQLGLTHSAPGAVALQATVSPRAPASLALQAFGVVRSAAASIFIGSARQSPAAIGLQQLGATRAGPATIGLQQVGIVRAAPATISLSLAQTRSLTDDVSGLFSDVGTRIHGLVLNAADTFPFLDLRPPLVGNASDALFSLFSDSASAHRLFFRTPREYLPATVDSVFQGVRNIIRYLGY